jgi:hypothetical protein
MFLIFPTCSFKCDRECGKPICQNSSLVQESEIEIETRELIYRYIKNSITHAVVCGGLEPMDSWDDLWSFICVFRGFSKDPIIIYTGYTEEEVMAFPCWEDIKKYSNIIIKFGRYRPNQNPHFDEVLGVKLCSDNQYAKEFNHEDTPM